MNRLRGIIISSDGVTWEDIGARTLEVLAADLRRQGGGHRLLTMQFGGDSPPYWEGFIVDASGLARVSAEEKNAWLVERNSR